MTKGWEYLRVQVDVNNVRKLDEQVAKLGREGWDLAGVAECADKYLHLWFKRPSGGTD